MESSAVLCLTDILQTKTRSRSTLSGRLSIAITVALSVMAGDILWSAITPNGVSTSSLYGVLAIYLAMMITGIIYCSITCFNGFKAETPLLSLRSWHKRAYKLVCGLTIAEHCIVFTAAPIILYHSLGLSMTKCFSAQDCSGMDYFTWVTVSRNGSQLRVQELRNEPVEASLKSENLAVFGGLLGALALGLIALSLYMFGEYNRRTAPSGGKPRSGMTLIRRRSRLIRLMGVASLAQLVFAIVGMAVVGSNWFAAPLILSIISLYPLYRLHKGLGKEATITRLHFRQISQTSIVLIFIWLYSSGSGVAASLISGIELSADQMFSLAGSSAIAQLVLLLVFHLGFSVMSGTAIYVHLSVTDVIESLQKTQNNAVVHPKDNDLGGTDTMVHTPQPPAAVMSWESRQCASCSTNDPNCVLVPCGHTVICSDCSKVLLTIPGFRCPLCCTEAMDSQIVSNGIH